MLRDDVCWLLSTSQAGQHDLVRVGVWLVSCVFKLKQGCGCSCVLSTITCAEDAWIISVPDETGEVIVVLTSCDTTFSQRKQSEIRRAGPVYHGMCLSYAIQAVTAVPRV